LGFTWRTRKEKRKGKKKKKNHCSRRKVAPISAVATVGRECIDERGDGKGEKKGRERLLPAPKCMKPARSEVYGNSKTGGRGGKEGRGGGGKRKKGLPPPFCPPLGNIHDRATGACTSTTKRGKKREKKKIVGDDAARPRPWSKLCPSRGPTGCRSTEGKGGEREKKKKEKEKARSI